MTTLPYALLFIVVLFHIIRLAVIVRREWTNRLRLLSKPRSNIRLVIQ